MRRRTAPLLTCLLAAPALALAPVADPHVGDTVSLTGSEPGERLDVTVTKVVDPAPTNPDDFQPDAGNHYVAVQFRLKNTGTAVYHDSPSNGATVIDKAGQRFDSTLGDSAAGPAFPASVNVGPGKTALGFITFEVSDGSRIVTVQFAMNSGFADDVGEWTVPKPS
ncbi:DUF4352 domain-containing protein [Streptomyces aquilus]|uniref:DUF4352 domain-containing protein n=1 Tax=Streptomyces aquilus TaxID=2548456 RepID=A0A3S9I9A0_9ACTN|nr:DUF4352 domain-containing protein [Streptomyces aquilus]AZP20892.1 DUF4352 domain-containing protein [Streptomyces aquilus]